MKIKVGTIIQSDFGTGPVTAITNGWVIHKTKDGSEVALCRDDSEYWIPVTDHEIGGQLPESQTVVPDAVLQLFANQSLSIGKVGHEVLVLCESCKDAKTVADWMMTIETELLSDS